MWGFFDQEKTKSLYRSGKGVFSCPSCGLYKAVLSPRMLPCGNFRKRIMVLGEGPGESEDQCGKPWQGKTGQVLQRKYKQLGIDLFDDCISLNAINCRALDKEGNNRTPTEHEISCCRQKVVPVIGQHKPLVIIAHGGAAVLSLIGHKWEEGLGGITKWRGWTIPDRDYNAWVCPTFHPSFIVRQEEQNEVDVIWTNDLKQAFHKADDLFPVFKNEEDCVVVSEDIEEVLALLSEEKPPLLAFDIETTGLKPYNKDDHKIVTISFCAQCDKAYAIPFPVKRKHLRLLKQLLENPEVGKVAANMKFEDNWLTVLHDINVYPWRFDTMLAAHILDNRPGITGLKFQAYVQFGVLGYGDEITPFLKSPDSNTPNQIMKLVQDAELFRLLLLYNGMDSLMTFRLAKVQMEILGKP